MTSSDERPPKPRRRLFWLAAFLVVLFAIYSAGWFYLADRLKTGADQAVARLGSKGIAAGCANLTVSGYPMSFTVSCDNIAYEDDARRVAASTGSFNAVAAITGPLSPVADLRGPLRTMAPGMPPLWIDWDQLQAKVKVSWPLPRSVSLQAEGLNGQTDPQDDTDPMQLFSAGKAAGQLQPSGQDINYVGSFGDLEINADAIDGRVLPALDGSGDVTLKNGVALIAAPPKSLRGQSIQIASLDLSSGTARITVSGPVSVDTEGLVNGDLMIKLKDPKAVASILAGAIPEHKSEIEQGFAALAMLGKEPSMPLKIVKGKASLGFIPLGKIKPLE
ncbi:DUF2125 domain-containing protein [Mesorhizobium sp. M2D.F.Ca.ET.185.01.1.1]|uniref:DUF2125 domain-containing protein n=2 Tax=Mesorhizobium TaxID=68287 RepID=UPI000FCAC32F|nr:MULTISPECIES: DUF2125 domain-containing protein [unclassified Mesorhizobium]TGP83266.1 DUF2125 domain-containing protein [bacterium M00.F.Ca.ET.227.01.1.1]TGP99221.1 DUF2125 domain-containing protein [bacterium M00.F.Ca.ET.221.01.1.1]TGP99951.1 DUF2125 domain-containing protein [bacterium M00.F.Ca.ET.222.01.1.1]TGU11338.1 DUF2125 domain-containing protein [bacterium M00.F.Ca.ET.163.01.1.1]TGU34934.1 DUF2125 domain-containing protein [bacterium M00.F.Ca.ET.156.01.1.1]TGU51282.1 DUF2125 doma